MWCGISSRRIIALISFHKSLSQGKRTEICFRHMPFHGFEHCEVVRFYARRCSPRIYGPVKELLDQNFGNDWIGKSGPFAWPTHSHELNPCDFYLWKPIKSNAFQVPITSIEHLKNRIREAIQIANKNTPMRAWDKMKERLDLLMYQNGGHIEHILQLKKSREVSLLNEGNCL